MKRLGWNANKGQQHLRQMYGVKSRLQLSDAQVWEFLDYLKSHSKFRVGETAMFRGMCVVVERLTGKTVALVRSWDNPKAKGFEAALCHLSPVVG